MWHESCQSYGAVVQPGLGRQIINLEVAGSNPVGPANSPHISLGHRDGAEVDDWCVLLYVCYRTTVKML